MYGWAGLSKLARLVLPALNHLSTIHTLITVTSLLRVIFVPLPLACSCSVAGATKSTKIKETPPLVQEALDQGFKVKVRKGYRKFDCIYFQPIVFCPSLQYSRPSPCPDLEGVPPRVSPSDGGGGVRGRGRPGDCLPVAFQGGRRGRAKKSHQSCSHGLGIIH